MSTISIPRWLLIATAALLAFAIFVIVVHPYYDVSNATAVEKVLLAAVITAIACTVVGAALMQAAVFARRDELRPLPIVERSCSRRI